MFHNLIWGVELCLGEIIPQNLSHGDEPVQTSVLRYN